MTKDILQAIFEGYALSLDGEHGPRHWGRVLVNGRRLAEDTGTDLRVVEMFALFHDSRRKNEEIDNGHGKRGAKLAKTLHEAGALGLTDDQFDLLYNACAHHTGGKVKAHPTIQTCWDADRLDLGRVWITPKPRYLCTSAAKNPKMIEWAEERSHRNHEESVVRTWLAWAGGQL